MKTQDELNQMGLECLGNANSCSEHETGIYPDDVVRTIAAYEEGYWEKSSVALLELKDGTYAVVEEESDSSGHG